MKHKHHNKTDIQGKIFSYTNMKKTRKNQQSENNSRIYAFLDCSWQLKQVSKQVLLLLLLIIIININAQLLLRL